MEANLKLIAKKGEKLKIKVLDNCVSQRPENETIAIFQAVRKSTRKHKEQFMTHHEQRELEQNWG